MIEVKRTCSSSRKDNLSKLTYTFGDWTIRFTEEEYRALTDLIAESKEKPEDILQAIIEEGLYSFMQGD